MEAIKFSVRYLTQRKIIKFIKELDFTFNDHVLKRLNKIERKEIKSWKMDFILSSKLKLLDSYNDILDEICLYDEKIAEIRERSKDPKKLIESGDFEKTIELNVKEYINLILDKRELNALEEAGLTDSDFYEDCLKSQNFDREKEEIILKNALIGEEKE